MLRAFTATFRCAIDDAELLEDGLLPPTLEDIKDYLKGALILDFDQDGNGNPVNLESIEVDIESLKELNNDELKHYYPNA